MADNNEIKYQLPDLLYLMSRLRHPETGCPWDLKQSYQTIVSHTLEEAYEVVDAINRGNKQDLKDELGDLLFQVIFYARLGEEDKAFDFNDVVDNIVKKLLRRHPHVFPEGKLQAVFPQGTRFTDEQIKAQWEAIKQLERQQKKDQVQTETPGIKAGIESVLSDIPTNLPALNRAEKLQKRASQHGFDWTEIEPVFAKVAEELAELKQVLAQAGDTELTQPLVHQRLQDELGDVLFSCVNLARFLKVNPDQALRGTNNKFVQRFQFIEEQLVSRGCTLDDVPLEELDRLWDQAKSRL